MQISIQFDLVQILGIAVIAWLAGNLGSVIGILITAIHTPSLDGQKLWTVAGMLQALLGMQIPKIIIAVIGASVAINYFPDTPIKVASWICGILGLGFMVVVGLVGRKR